MDIGKPPKKNSYYAMPYRSQGCGFLFVVWAPDEKIYKMLRAGKSEQKAEFALDVIFEISPDELSVPPYINQGLMWLQDYLHPED